MSFGLRFWLNGQEVEVEVEPDETLLWVLRERLNRTGTKVGCEAGDCGACTVLLDGRPVTSCLLLAPKVHGRQVVTIEGLGSPERLHPLQQAFIEHGALQCGFCGPGMLLSAAALLTQNPHPTEAEVREAISGNLCRCTGYRKIVQAILSVAHATSRR